MAEYIISEEELNSMLDAIGSPHIEDGEEIIRCRDCKKADKQEWKCNHFAVGYWDPEQEADVILRHEITPYGHCAWAERDE